MTTKIKLPKSSKFRASSLLVFALVIGILGYLILFQGRAAVPPPPTVYLTPETSTLAVNTTFTVQVRENSSTTPLSAVEVHLSYPATLVDFVGISTTGSPFTQIVESTGGTGSVVISSGADTSSGTGAQITGDQLVGTVTFKTKTATGTGTMAFTAGTVLASYSASGSTDVLGSLTRTQGMSVTVDATAPTVSVTAPLNGAIVSAGTTTPISITATDNTAVSNVQIYVDGGLKTTLTASPYNYTWDTNGLALGNHTVQAKASDAYGNTGTSSLITVTLADKTAPTTSITAPLANATLKGTTTVTATATDNAGGTGVAKVEFYVDGILKSTSTTAPYSYAWNTLTIADGAHTVSTKAYDNAVPANVGSSANVAVTVKNADTTAPTTPASFRVTATTLTSVSLAWNASTDDVGVTGYRITRNGNVIATVTGLAYDDTALASATTYNYTVVAVDAAGNASAAATVSGTTITPKVGDFNGDNRVDVLDLGLLIANWKTTNATYDINKNGLVDIFDLGTFISNYGK